MRKGAAWFAGLGPLNSGGTVIFSVSGHVEKPCNLELPMGIPFKDLMELCGGVWKGRKLKAVIPGGSSCMVVPAEIMWNVNMDYDSLKKPAPPSAPAPSSSWMRPRAWCGRWSVSRVFICRSPAASARPAGKALDGSTAC